MIVVYYLKDAHTCKNAFAMLFNVWKPAASKCKGECTGLAHSKVRWKTVSSW